MLWLLPAGVVVASLLTATLLFRTVAREAAALRQALLDLERVAVAVDDLGHDARGLGRTWQRLGRQ